MNKDREFHIGDRVWWWDDTGLHEGTIIAKRRFFALRYRYDITCGQVVVTKSAWRLFYTKDDALNHRKKGHVTRAKTKDVDSE